MASGAVCDSPAVSRILRCPIQAPLLGLSGVVVAFVGKPSSLAPLNCRLDRSEAEWRDFFSPDC
jgi:hypothetical protein